MKMKHDKLHEDTKNLQEYKIEHLTPEKADTLTLSSNIV